MSPRHGSWRPRLPCFFGNVQTKRTRCECHFRAEYVVLVIRDRSFAMFLKALAACAEKARFFFPSLSYSTPVVSQDLQRVEIGKVCLLLSFVEVTAACCFCY